MRHTLFEDTNLALQKSTGSVGLDTFISSWGNKRLQYAEGFLLVYYKIQDVIRQLDACSNTIQHFGNVSELTLTLETLKLVLSNAIQRYPVSDKLQSQWLCNSWMSDFISDTYDNSKQLVFSHIQNSMELYADNISLQVSSYIGEIQDEHYVMTDANSVQGELIGTQGKLRYYGYMLPDEFGCDIIVYPCNL